MSKEHPTMNDIDLTPFIFQLYDIKNIIEEMIIELEKMKEGIRNV